MLSRIYSKVPFPAWSQMKRFVQQNKMKNELPFMIHLSKGFVMPVVLGGDAMDWSVLPVCGGNTPSKFVPSFQFFGCQLRPDCPLQKGNWLIISSPRIGGNTIDSYEDMGVTVFPFFTPICLYHMTVMPSREQITSNSGCFHTLSFSYSPSRSIE